jgi:heme exporter protein C
MMPMSTRSARRSGPFPAIHLALAAVLMFLAIWVVFRYVPTAIAANGEPNPVQRIFYFHVPSAFMTFIAVGIVFICSIVYLSTRRRAFDRVSGAATEIGMLFCTIVLVTGPIWAKPEWGRAWTWEPRLNLTAVLWLIFLGSVLVRAYSDNRDAAGLLCSVLGIVTLPVSVLVYVSVEMLGGVHPKPTIGRSAASHDPRITIGLLICLLAFSVFTLWLLSVRSRLVHIEEHLEDLRAAVEEPDTAASAGPVRTERSTGATGATGATGEGGEIS